ncbi:MAG TPA: VTC domain-containing protein [Myxococcaceae bacterium]|nr:VTC domain-containing protein [Myxococcaceae bacterium]
MEGLAFAEGAVTRVRREFKLVLGAGEAVALLERLSNELGGPASCPTLITSVYFDGPELPLAQRALRQPGSCLKVRTKEYFPDLGGAEGARVVLEAKREHHGLTHKKRAWLPRERLRAAVQGHASVLPLIANGRLRPVLGVTYVREVYQHTEAWRVTVDRDIAFYLVTSDVALSERRVGPERLGPPLGRDERVVVEVKHQGDTLPPWLAGLRERKSPPYSKFTEGMARLMESRVDGAMGG